MTAADVAPSGTGVGAPSRPDTTGGPRAARVPAGLVGAAVAVGVLLAGAAAALAARAWVPIEDDGLIWLRARDVGTRHSPLVGLYSRYGWYHPGPAVFVYQVVFLRLALARPAALLAGALVAAATCAGLAVWLAGRAGGTAAAVPVAVGVGVLAIRLGDWLIDPWTPRIVVLPFLAFVAAAWAWTTGERRALPIAAGLGTFVVQTHVSMTLPVAAIGAVALALRLGGPPAGAPRPSLRRPPVVTLVVLGLLWAPPVLQQLLGHPGNLSTLVSFFTAKPPEVAAGWATGSPMAARLLLPWGPWIGRNPLGLANEPLPLTVWWLAVPVAAVVVPAAVALRRGDGASARLGALLLAAQLASVYAEVRVLGPPYEYLTLWIRAVACLTAVFPFVVLARVIAGPTRRRAHAPARGSPALAPAIALGLVAAVAAVGVGRRVPDHRVQPVYRRLLPAAVASEPRGAVVRVVDAGRVFTSSSASIAVELDRNGRTPRIPPLVSVTGTLVDQAGRSRRAPPDAVLPTLVVASDASIDQVSARPGARVVATADPLPPALRAEADNLRARLVAQAEALGHADVAGQITGNLSAVLRPPDGLDVVALRRLQLLTIPNPVVAVIALPATTWPLGS